MLRRFAVTVGMLGLVACGGTGEGDEMPGNRVASAPDARAESEAEVAAAAELANQAAVAEAEDAAIGGNVSAADVAAANLQ